MTKKWRGRAPLLWPATGTTTKPKDAPDSHIFGTYLWRDRAYPMPPHGFAMNQAWSVDTLRVDHAHALTRVRLADTPESRALYPFGFQLSAEYTLQDGTVSIAYAVKASAPNAEPLFFSIGNHISFQIPLVKGSVAQDTTIETPCSLEFLRDAQKAATGESKPRSIATPTPLSQLPVRNSPLSLGGYANTAAPWLRMTDPSGLALTLRHTATSLPENGALVRFNLWADETLSCFCPEPWVGLQNSFNSRQGLVEVAPGGEWHWAITLEIQHPPNNPRPPSPG